MKRRRNSSGDGGGDSWMNTYADMVTLLLCFFVLLYSMSTIDQQKWAFLLSSLNPEASMNAPYELEGEESEVPPIVEDDEEGNTTFEEIEELYLILQAYVQENGLEASVELEKGEGFVMITFRDSIFFDGDSYVLKQEGATILDVLANGMNGLNDSIGEVRILGHTAQSRPDRLNNIYEDRYLSSNRAVEVLLHLQAKDILDARKYISLGYGQHYPVVPNDSEENRAQNRRVEIIIIQNDDKINLALESVYDQLGIGYEDEEAANLPQNTGEDEPDTEPPGTPDSLDEAVDNTANDMMNDTAGTNNEE